MLLNVIAATNDIEHEDLARLRHACIEGVRKINGSVSIDNTIEWQESIRNRKFYDAGNKEKPRRSGAIYILFACFLSDSDNKIAFFSIKKDIQDFGYFIFVFCIIFGFGKSRQMI